MQKTASALYKAGMAALEAGDYDRAMECFTQAADQGHADAQYECGQLYYLGRSCADTRDFPSLMLCACGMGKAEDYARALVWYEKAAAQGHLQAQIRCATMYAQGLGTEEDRTQALAWYEKAAAQGDAESQYVCGERYYRGDGTAKDDVRALAWYEQAAQNRHIPAQLACGRMYRDGEGTAKDREKARLWYRRAANRGDAQAQAALEELAARAED